MAFVQLWQDDAAGALKTLDWVLKKGKLKLEVVEEHAEDKEMVEEEKCLVVTVVRIHSTQLFALMHFGATPNVLSPVVSKHLSMDLEHMKKVVTVADGCKSLVKWQIVKKPVSLDALEVKMDFIVMQNVPFDLFTDRPTLKRMGDVLGFKTEEVRFDYRGRQAVFQKVSEYSRPHESAGDTASEEITSASNTEEHHVEGVKEKKKNQELVLCLQNDDMDAWSQVDSSSCKEQVALVQRELDTKLDHLPAEVAAQTYEMMVSSDVVAYSLWDLRHVTVPVQHFFELKDDSRINHRCMRMPPKHNDIVWLELGTMLEARIVTPASSAWSLLVVIATKKDGNPRFCVDYSALNQRMKSDRFPVSMIQEIFDELIGGLYFTTLDFFSGYC